MYRVMGGRGTGKTRKLMEIAKKEGAIFVCSNPYSMEQKAKNYGIIGLTFMGYSEFLKRTLGVKEQVKYVVDELEIFIPHTMNTYNTLVGYSLSEE